MTSDYISFMHMPERSRIQGAAQLQGVGAADRKDPAERGQDLPPGKAVEEEQTPDAEKLDSAVSRIRDYVQNFQRDLQFSVDSDSGRTVIKVVDSQTNRVIRQLPSEESLRIAQELDSPESVMLSELA